MSYNAPLFKDGDLIIFDTILRDPEQHVTMGFVINVRKQISKPFTDDSFIYTIEWIIPNKYKRESYTASYCSSALVSYIAAEKCKGVLKL